MPTLVINNQEKQKELTRWCKHSSGVLDLNVDEKLLYHIFSAFGVIHINHDAFEEPNAAMKVMYGQYLCNRQFMVSYAYKMSLEYWFYGKSPLMKVSLNNNTLRARCFEKEGNIRNAISIWIIFVVYGFS